MNQFEYLKTLPGSLNQLKWKQFMNQFISLETEMKTKDIIDVVACIARFPCQKKRHDLFSLLAQRVLVSEHQAQLTAEQKLQILRYFLHAGIDIADAEFSRFKKSTWTQARILTDTLVKEFIAECFLHNELKETESINFIHSVSLALCKGWSLPACLDSRSERLDRMVDSALKQINRSSLEQRGELVWGLGVLVKYDLADPGRFDRIVKRSLVQAELVPFQTTRNFTNIALASKESFVALEQLRQGFENLEICKNSSVFPFLQNTIEVASSDESCRDAAIACSLLWWYSVSESRVNRLVVEWVRTCVDKVDQLSENERWIASNGLRHLVSLERNTCSNDDVFLVNLSESEKNHLIFCVDQDVFNKQKRNTVSWRKGGDKQFIKQA